MLMLPDTLLLNNEFRPYSEGERLNDFDFEGEVESELIAKHLIEQMDAHGGVGLTASQIGINARVFAFKENTGSSLINVVAFNPEIVSYSDEIALESEGCLSYPGLFIKIKRPKSLQVKYMTAIGQEIDTVLGEFSARVFGHEFDHCEGVDFRDRAARFHLQQGNMKRKYWLRKMKQANKKMAKQQREQKRINA